MVAQKNIPGALEAARDVQRGGKKSLAAGDFQIVLDGEHARNAVRSYSGDVLIALVIDRAFKRYVPVRHNNVDRGHGAHRVAVHRAIAENCTVSSAPNLPIETRQRQNFDLVDHLRYALNLLHDVLSIRLERRIRDIADERYGAAVDLESEVVEDVVIGQHGEFMAYAFRKRLRIIARHQYSGDGQNRTCEGE